MMGKIAFVFPGQGAQYAGMGKLIADNFKTADEIFEQASCALGYDMKKMVSESSEDVLKITENTQPAILTVSMACLSAVYDSGIRKPDVVAGLSLGEYSAHVASGTLSFQDAVGITKKRGRYMQEAVPEGIGTMAAIIGLSKSIVIDCCEKAMSSGIVEPANFNCPGQVVISGEINAVRKAIEFCIEMGARRAIELPVSAPFHCKMLTPTGEKLKQELDKIQFNEMKIPVVANINAQVLEDNSLVKDTLVKQVSSPVLWEDSVITMINMGVDTFVEIGPGKVLGGFIRKIYKDAVVLNVEDLQSLQNTIMCLQTI